MKLRYFGLASILLHGAALGTVMRDRWGARAGQASSTEPPHEATLAGDTLALPSRDEHLDDIEDSVDTEGLVASGEDTAPSAPGSRPAPAAPGERAATHDAPRNPRGARAASARGEADPASGEPAGSSALYGAVGDRSAVDFSAAFTRAFPQVASADGAWLNVPFGPAGEGELTVDLDSTGALGRARVSGPMSPTLRRGVERAVLLIKGRSFTAAGPTVHLHLVAVVSPDRVHDGLHGSVFAVGNSFTGGEGSAFFALAVGRRIDLQVQPRKP